MTFYLPFEYHDEPMLKEDFKNFEIINCKDNEKEVVLLNYRPLRETSELKSKLKNENRKFFRNRLLEAFLNSSQQNEEALKLFRALKINSTLQDNTAINFCDKILMNKEIMVVFEEICPSHKMMTEIQKKTFQESFDNFNNKFIRSFISNTEILFKQNPLFSKESSKQSFNENEKTIKYLCSILLNIKEQKKIASDLIFVKQTENELLIKSINSKLVNISSLIKKKAENLIEKSLGNYQEELSLKQVPYEYLALKTKLFEMKTLERLFPNKNALESYSCIIKKLKEQKQSPKIYKEMSLKKTQNDSGEMKQYLEKIKLIEKEINAKKESIHKYKKN